MICAHCSTEMPDVSSYCPVCGEPVHDRSAGFTALNLMDGVLGALAYFWVIPAIVLLSVPATRRSGFVRFHAWQGLLFAGSAMIVALVLRLAFMIFSVLGSLGFLVAWLLVGVAAIAVGIIWLALVIKAILGHSYELPFIGPVASSLATHGPFSASPS
jgi:uncharacterized membrane protein